MRVQRTIHQRLAGAQAFTFLHVDVNTARHGVLLLLAVICRDVDLALALGDFAEADDTIDLADNGRLTRLAGFEELDDARQTAGDVLGAGGFARDLRQDVSGEDLVAVLHHEVSAAGHQIALVALGALDEDGRLALLIRSVGDHETRQAGDLVDLFVERDALLQVLELHRAADLGEDGEGVRVPLCQGLAERDVRTLFHLQLRAVDDLVALLLAATLVDDGDGAKRAMATRSPALSGRRSG